MAVGTVAMSPKTRLNRLQIKDHKSSNQIGTSQHRQEKSLCSQDSETFFTIPSAQKVIQEMSRQ